MDRLRQRADFLAVANGARVNSPAFVLQSLDRRSLDPGSLAPESLGPESLGPESLGRDDGGRIRIGFTVTKKNGNAPERNRIRRRLRELVKRLDPVSLPPHHDYVLVGRRDALSRDFATMLDDLRIAFTKPARHMPKGSAKGLAKGRGQRPSPAPAASRKPD